MNRLLWSLLLFISPIAFSQVLLKDANAVNAGTHPTNLVNANGTIYFVGNTRNQQTTGIYTTDGTAAGTQLVREPYPNADNVQGPYLNFNSQLFQLGNKVVFQAYGYNPNYTGYELWSSDGTNAGTKLVKDIYPGSNSSNPFDFVSAGNKVFFRATDGVNGTELWATDGTTAGTQLVRDTSPGSSSQYLDLRRAKVVGNKLYFTYYDATYGEELWVSDGTPAGTILLKDIQPGSSSSNPSNLTVVGDKLYFNAYDNTNGNELWVTDGTPAGTTLIIDLFPGSNSSNPYSLVEFNNKLLFTSYGIINNSYGTRIWITDGTPSGTTILKDRNNYGPSPNSFKKIGNRLFFTNTGDGETPGRELWITDGTPNGTKLVKDINLTSKQYADYTFPYFGPQFFDVNGKLFFLANTGLEGFELWQSDGTEVGTTLIRDFVSGTVSADYKNFKVLGNELYFIVNDDSGNYNCWKTDGTLAGTVKMSDITPGANVQNLFPLEAIGSTLYLAGFGKGVGYELYKTDGSSVSLVKDVLQEATYDNEFANLRYKTSLDNKLIYTYDDGLHGQELWKTDGYEGGTNRLTDISKYPNLGYNYGQVYANPAEIYSGLINMGAFAYFRVNNAIWRTDGTTTELWRSPDRGSLYQLMQLDNYLYWFEENKLYKSDGTTVTLVKEIADFNYSYYSQTDFISINGFLLFYFNTATYGFELWKTDGTSTGTNLVRDINPGTSFSDGFNNSEEIFTEVNGKVYFTARTNNEGRELWVTDGTTSGTNMVKDIRTGSNNSSPRYLTKLNNTTLIFSAQEDNNGEDIWRTDGTAAGTVKVTELNTSTYQYPYVYRLLEFNGGVFYGFYNGSDRFSQTNGLTNTTIKSNYYIREMAVFNNELYVSATDYNDYKGEELYKTDGTVTGTVLVKDIYPGGNNSSPRNFYVHNNDLYFTADDGVHGNEVYIIRTCADSLNIATTITDEENIKAGRIIVGETANKLTASARVTYDAGKYILLKAGFSTESGAVFTTVLNGCANTSSAVMVGNPAQTDEASAEKPVMSAKTAQYLQDLREMPTIEQFLQRTEDESIAEIYDRYQQKTRPMLSDMQRLQTELREIEKSEREVRTAEGTKSPASLFETKETKTATLRETEQSLRQQTARIRLVRNNDGVKTGYELVIRMDGKEHIAKVDLPQ